jgi:AraC-like DNA-binding protein
MAGPAPSTGVPQFGDQLVSAGPIDLHAAIASFPQGGSGSFNHTEPSITYVESGQVWFAMNGFSGWISGGSLVVMPAGLRTVSAGAQTCGISMGLGRSQLPGRYAVQPAIVALPRRKQGEWLERTLAIVDRPDSDRRELARSVEDVLTNAVEGREKRRAALIADVLATVERNSRYGLPLRELGERFGYSPNHLNEIVSLNTGRSIRQWEIGFRLEMARRLLKRPDLAIAVVAAEMGMDAPYFTRAFRARYRLTPSAWRANVFGGANFETMAENVNANGVVSLERGRDFVEA